jgi:hypothetical protein
MPAVEFPSDFVRFVELIVKRFMPVMTIGSCWQSVSAFYRRLVGPVQDRLASSALARKVMTSANFHGPRTGGHVRCILIEVL